MLTTGVLLENRIVRANGCVLTEKLTPQCNAHKRDRTNTSEKKFQPTMQVVKRRKYESLRQLQNRASGHTCWEIEIQTMASGNVSAC